MFKLFIVFIFIANGHISFLTNYFTTSEIICERNEITEISQLTSRTYHVYKLPKGNCFLKVSGTQKILYPSVNDTIIREIVP